MGLPNIFRSAACFALVALTALADPLSTSRRVDFFRDVTSRNLHGVAARSDGRLISGAQVSLLRSDLDADLLWSAAATKDQLYLGTGPDGKILSLDAHNLATSPIKTVAELPGAHILALTVLPNGDLLAGTSPDGSLALIHDGEVVSRVKLPVGSILDINVYQPTGAAPEVLVATGNPGRIYRVDVAQLAKAASTETEDSKSTDLAAAGITPWGSIRDENVRTLLRRTDGRVIAGSAPKGNIYEFAHTGGSPSVLAENRNAEVTSLLEWDGGIFAAITYSSDNRENRVKRTAENSKPVAKNNDDQADKTSDGDAPPFANPTPAPASADKFRGRAQLVWLPDGGFPETVANRQNTAFYQLHRFHDLVLITGGEEGELLGYDPARMRNLTFAGATAAQVNAIIDVPGKDSSFVLIGNNPGGLELMDFAATGPLTAETQRIDLGIPSEIGALRFDQSIAPEDSELKVEMRASYSSDELEGWGDWQPAIGHDGGWSIAGLRGRFVQLRLSSTARPFEVAAGNLFTLPQNRRPQLQNFRVLAPNFAIIPAPERTERSSTSLGQILQGGKSGGGRDNFLSSEVVPQPGTQVVFWSVDDQDGDNLVSTFSIRGPQDTAWTDLIVNTATDFAQFEISHLPEGVYRTRLVVNETAPRPVADRLSATFETDDFVVDRSPPEILEAHAKRNGAGLIVTVRARDAISLLRGVEFNLNNGSTFDVEQPADGILDGREETFVLELSGPQVGDSTSVEIVALDQNSNSAARRLAIPTN